jgi:hypothetical protein
MSDLSPLPEAERQSNFGAARTVDDLERTSRCFGLVRCGHQEFCTGIAVEQFQRVAQRHRVLVGCAAASMRYHDEIRVFSRLMAKSVVGNNQ